MSLGRAIVILLAVGLTLGVASVGVGTQLENRDAFCASCHTEPETVYFNRSMAAPVDLASTHAGIDTRVRCIDCHSGEGIAGRALSLEQGAGDLLAYVLGNYTSPALTTNPVGDAGCTKCHIPIEEENTNPPSTAALSNSHYHFAAYLTEWKARKPNAAGACARCHPSHLEIGVEGQDFSGTTTSAACDDCHAALSGWRPEDN